MNLVERDGKIAWRLNLNSLEEHHSHLCSFPREKLLGNKYDGPTLVIRGANSNYIKDEDSALFDSFFPHWTLATINGAGHWVHSEQPAHFIFYVAGFLNAPT